MIGEQSELREAMLFLEDLAGAVLDSSRVRPGQSVAGRGPNTTGGSLIRPGGRDCYPAFWIRDFAMSLECGLIALEELEHALLLTARCQAREDWLTPAGSLVPRGSIADHITFDAKPIYFPGTYEFEAQGQPWGYYPSLDDPFYFVEMAWQLAIAGGRTAILREEIDGMELLERLDLAFSVPTVIEDGSELVWCDENERGVGFGFTDSIIHTGRLLFCSILRCRAARQLADLHGLCGKQQAVEQYRDLARRISESVSATFACDNGLLLASTGKSAQPDVWGSAFAVYSNVLSKQEAGKVAQALLRCLSEGTIAWKGNIRHVPTDCDFSDVSAWEETVGGRARNEYQTGAYWNTPTGGVCYAVAQVDDKAARELALQYVEELRAGDFRQGAEYGSPYECLHLDGDYRRNPVYLTSVTCPLAAFQRLGWIRREDEMAEPSLGSDA